MEGCRRCGADSHELAHWFDLGPDTAPTSGRGDAEIVAEAVAYIVGARLGLDTSNYSAGYVASWANGDAQSLPLPDQSADIVSIAFGIRNVQDVPTALKEFHRILRPGGRVIILEFSLPTNRILRGLYNFYFRQILPCTATWISGDKTGAYRYLPKSVNTFLSREQMAQAMSGAGFTDISQHPLTFGIAVAYLGRK